MSGHGTRMERSSLRFGSGQLAQVPVRIGEVKTAPAASLLFTIGLGSCVAVALYDAAARVGGLAHAILPRPEKGHRAGPPARFASVAVPLLIEQLVDQGAAAERLRARLAGGASMFADLLDRAGMQLGRRNVEEARRALEAAHIPIDGEDVFGTWGRSVFLRTDDGALLVTSVAHGDVYL